MNPRPVILALCCAIAIVVGVYLVGSYYFGQSRLDDTPADTNNKPGPTGKGHWHGDVWHDETTNDSEPTAVDETTNSPPPPDKTEIIMPVSVPSDETHAPRDRSIKQAREAKRLADYEKQRAQYFQDHEKWSSKFSDSWDERMRRSEVLLNLLPDTVEEVNNLSDDEKHQLAERMMEQLSRIAEADEELESVEQEEPILPPPPENN